MEMNNNINYEDYIGREVNDYTGKVGHISRYYKEDGIFTVEFDDDFWNYPADLIIKQLEQKEELTKMMEKDEEAGIYDTDDSEISVDPIVERVCNKFRQRSEVGVRKYNTTLADSTDGIDKFLLHLQEELMDAVNYIETLKHKIQILKDSL